MTVVNPKSISGINSITTGSGSDNLLTIHTNDGTERLRVDSTGTTKIVTGIVTTLTATTGIVTTLTANTGTFSDTVTFNNTHIDIADSIRHVGDSDAKIRFPVADTFTVETAGSERLRINSSGQVGIGTTNPSTYKLHLHGSTSALARFERIGGDFAKVDIKAGGSSGNSYLTFSDPDASEVGEINYEHGDNSLRINTNSAERLRITSAGDVNVLTGQMSVTTPEYLRVAHTDATHNQSLSDNSTHWIQFGSAYNDTKSGWTSGASNYYEIQKSGYFLVTTQAVITSNNANSLREYSLGIERSTDNGSSWTLLMNNGARGGGNDETDTDTDCPSVTHVLYYTAGDRIRVRAHANTDGGTWQVDEDLDDTGGNYGSGSFDNQKGTQLMIVRLF